MANKYANLVGTNKIKDEYTKINTGFDRVEVDINKLETDVTAVNTRVDTIITTPISGAAATQEIVDARVSAVKAKTFASLDARFEETEQDIATHMADNVNLKTVHGLRIEAGTWTPTIESFNVPGSNTYENQTGIFYKIGRLIFCHGRVHLSSKDNSMDGGVRIGGLPFAASAGYHSISFGWVSYFNYNDNSKELVGYVIGNTIPLYESVDNGNRIVVLPSQINDNTEFRFSVIYTTV